MFFDISSKRIQVQTKNHIPIRERQTARKDRKR